jgi:hypothetical protein
MTEQLMSRNEFSAARIVNKLREAALSTRVDAEVLRDQRRNHRNDPIAPAERCSAPLRMPRLARKHVNSPNIGTGTKPGERSVCTPDNSASILTTWRSRKAVEQETSALLPSCWIGSAYRSGVKADVTDSSGSNALPNHLSALARNAHAESPDGDRGT